MSDSSSKLFPLSEHQVLLFLLVTLFVVIVHLVNRSSPIFDLQPCGELLTWVLLIPIYIVGSQAYFGQVKPFSLLKLLQVCICFIIYMNIHCMYYLFRIVYIHTSLYVSCLGSYKCIYLILVCICNNCNKVQFLCSHPGFTWAVINNIVV